MGISGSTTVQGIDTNIYTTAANDCSTVSSENYFTMTNSTYYPPPGCPADQSSFNVDQTSVVNADCFIENMQQIAAQQTYNLSNDTKSQLGISVSATATMIQNTFSETVNNECTGESTTNSVTLDNDTINACGFYVIQNASSYQQCQINSTQKIIGDMTQDVVNTTSGSSVAGLLFGSGWTSILIWAGLVFLIIAIVVIGIIIYFMLKKKKVKDTSNIYTSEMNAIGDTDDFVSGYKGGNGVTKKKSTIILVILAIIVVIALLYGMTKNNTKKIVDEEIKQLKKDITVTKKLANISPMNTPTSPEPTELNNILNQEQWLHYYNGLLD